jgi:hypothetical protein
LSQQRHSLENQSAFTDGATFIRSSRGTGSSLISSDSAIINHGPTPWLDPASAILNILWGTSGTINGLLALQLEAARRFDVRIERQRNFYSICETNNQATYNFYFDVLRSDLLQNVVERKISAGLLPPFEYLPPNRKISFTLTSQEETEILHMIVNSKDPDLVDSSRHLQRPEEAQP